MPRAACLALLTMSLIAPRGYAAAPPPPDLAAKARAVLQQHCGSCHGDGPRPKGGLGTITDLSRLVASKQVVPHRPDASPLFARVVSGEMPPGWNAFTLADRETLAAWIRAGAPLPEVAVATLSRRDLLARIDADRAALPERDRRFVKYLTLNHLAHRPIEERESLTQAVAKVVNSLSWHARLTPPRVVVPGAVVALDLRDYKWTARAWDRLAALDPYAEAPPAGVLRADWFVATATKPPHYHDFLNLPTTDRALERLVNLDAADSLDEGTAMRAGFNGSGVARANRAIERHDAAFGAYWRSFDFTDNTDRQNLFENPLGPKPGPASFKHAGGEIIFHLPNGLQGYLLVDGDGRRVDRAPGEIVSDPARPDRLVVNGLSCMGCHHQGIIPKDDQVRAHVAKNPKAFADDVRRDILALYPPAATWKRRIDEDNERFAAALKKLGVTPGEREPVRLTVARYEDTVDATSAAAELGVTVERLRDIVRNTAALSRPLGPLAAGGNVQRGVFEDAYAKLAAARGTAAEAEPVAAEGVYRGHDATVTALAWRADGKRYASGDASGVVVLHDPSAKTATRLAGHREEISALVFVGDTLASCEGDRRIRLWGADGKHVATLEGHTAPIRALAASPDGKALYSGGEDKVVRFWDVASRKETRAASLVKGVVTHLAVSPDGKKLLVTASHEAVVAETETGKAYWPIRLPPRLSATSATFDGSGKFAVMSLEPGLIVRELIRGAGPTTPRGTPEVTSFVGTDGAGKLYVGGRDPKRSTFVLRRWVDGFNIPGGVVTTFESSARAVAVHRAGVIAGVEKAVVFKPLP